MDNQQFDILREDIKTLSQNFRDDIITIHEKLDTTNKTITANDKHQTTEMTALKLKVNSNKLKLGFFVTIITVLGNFATKLFDKS